MPVKSEKWGWSTWTWANKLAVVCMAVYLSFTAVEIVRLLLGHDEDLKNDFILPSLAFGLVVWAYIYAVMSTVNEKLKKLIGIVEVVVGFGLMVFQLYDLRGKLAQHDMAWRWTVIFGTVALFSKGVKDLIKLDKDSSHDEDDAARHHTRLGTPHAG